MGWGGAQQVRPRQTQVGTDTHRLGQDGGRVPSQDEGDRGPLGQGLLVLQA